jgi:hypothetical protein
MSAMSDCYYIDRKPYLGVVYDHRENHAIDPLTELLHRLLSASIYLIRPLS